MLLVNDSFDTIFGVCQAECFYAEAHRLIFSTFQTMYEAGSRTIDIVTMRDGLQKQGVLDQVGGTDYILKILETVPHAAHADHYAKIIRENWICRRLIEESTYTLKEAHEHPSDVDALLADAENRIGSIDNGSTDEFFAMTDIMQAVELVICERADTDGECGVGLPTGSHELDQLIGGLKKKNVVVVAARPSMGKTAYSCDVVAKLAASNHPGVIFSLEMSKEELAERLLAAEAKVRLDKLQRGDLEEFEHYEFSQASARMRAWPMLICDKGYIKISKLTAMLRRLKRTHKIEWCVIDYMQLIEADDQKIIREQQIASISRRIKQASKDIDIPIIVLAQLNRETEKREDKRPRLSDLRESGAIEQDADVVILLHRPEKYDPDDRKGEIDLIVAKNRHGPDGVVTLSWSAKTMSFKEFSPVSDVGDDF